ncbi:hypothetical protein SAMN05421545_0440 [Pontibacter lucknowensis]|uniref:Uncharacterized protein n=1 Tax=Pontibacter lucknowensis TaxID=1077936 RepID=A0A1N6TPY1_9BACT|nr:hypothetical protein SAMN05421545_0440 [Pontibacter lucknowensis]
MDLVEVMDLIEADNVIIDSEPVLLKSEGFVS